MELNKNKMEKQNKNDQGKSNLTNGLKGGKRKMETFTLTGLYSPNMFIPGSRDYERVVKQSDLESDEYNIIKTPQGQIIVGPNEYYKVLREYQDKVNAIRITNPKKIKTIEDVVLRTAWKDEDSETEHDPDLNEIEYWNEDLDKRYKD